MNVDCDDTSSITTSINYIIGNCSDIAQECSDSCKDSWLNVESYIQLCGQDSLSQQNVEYLQSGTETTQCDHYCNMNDNSSNISTNCSHSILNGSNSDVELAQYMQLYGQIDVDSLITTDDIEITLAECECVTGITDEMIDCQNADDLAAIIVQFLTDNKEICIQHCNIQNISNANETLCLQSWNLLIQIDNYCNEPAVDQVIYEWYSQVCHVHIQPVLLFWNF